MKIFGREIGCGHCIPAVDTPVGDACMRCDVPIKAGDVGIIMPHMGPEGTVEKPWHLACFRLGLGIGGEPS
jgi:hypothetical protein